MLHIIDSGSGMVGGILGPNPESRRQQSCLRPTSKNDDSQSNRPAKAATTALGQRSITRSSRPAILGSETNEHPSTSDAVVDHRARVPNCNVFSRVPRPTSSTRLNPEDAGALSASSRRELALFSDLLGRVRVRVGWHAADWESRMSRSTETAVLHVRTGNICMT